MKKKFRYETEEQFIREYLESASGRKQAFRHVMALCRACIKANPATRKEAKRIAQMNSHAIRELAKKET